MYVCILCVHVCISPVMHKHKCIHTRIHWSYGCVIFLFMPHKSLKYIHTYTHTHTCSYAAPHPGILLHISCMQTYIPTNMCGHAGMRNNMDPLHIHIYMYVYIHTYIHTYTHTSCSHAGPHQHVQQCGFTQRGRGVRRTPQWVCRKRASQ